MHEIPYALAIPLPGVSKELKADACMSVITEPKDDVHQQVCVQRECGLYKQWGINSTLERNEIQVHAV